MPRVLETFGRGQLPGVDISRSKTPPRMSWVVGGEFRAPRGDAFKYAEEARHHLDDRVRIPWNNREASRTPVREGHGMWKGDLLGGSGALARNQGF